MLHGIRSPIRHPSSAALAAQEIPAHPARALLERLRPWRLFLILLAALTAVRLTLAPLTEHFVNRLLSRHSDYRGRIGDVDIDLWRGAYVIEDLQLLKRIGETTEPFLSAESVDFSMQWSGLLHGALVGEVILHQPSMNFIVGASKEESQTSIDPAWQETANGLFPFKIDRIQVIDGDLRFRDLSQDPVVDVHLGSLQADVRNLTNIREVERAEEAEKELVATAEVTARPLDQGSFWLRVQLDPFASQPTFDLDASLKGLNLVPLNDFLRAYANLDVERGTLHVFTEMAASQGRITGYIKPFLEDVEVTSSREVQGAGDLLQAAWEKIAEGAAHLLENQERDQTAARIPYEGRIEDPHAGVIATIGTLLANAFIRALVPDLDDSVDLADAERKQSGREKAERVEEEKKIEQSKGEAGTGPGSSKN